MNPYSDYWKEAVTRIRNYSQYIDETTALYVQVLMDEEVTEEAMNITAAIDGIVKLSKVPFYFFEYGDDTEERLSKFCVKIPFRGITIWLAVAVPQVDNTKEIERLESLILKSESKLSNERFVQNAPPAIVEEERRKLEDFKKQLQQYR